MTTSVLASIVISARCQLIPRPEGAAPPHNPALQNSCHRAGRTDPRAALVDAHAACRRGSALLNPWAGNLGGELPYLAERSPLRDKYGAGLESREHGTCKRRSRQSRALKSARHAPSCGGQYRTLPSSAGCRNLPSRGRKNSIWCRAPVAAISTPSGPPSSSTVSSSSTTAACERVCADRLRLELRLAEALGARFGDRLVVTTDARHADAADALLSEHQ